MSFSVLKTEKVEIKSEKNQTLIQSRNNMFDKQLFFMTNNCNRAVPPNMREC